MRRQLKENNSNENQKHIFLLRKNSFMKFRLLKILLSIMKSW